VIAAGGQFDLVRDGKPACAIVIAERPSPAARLAALELQSHVLKITGIELPLRDDAASTEAARILVGESAATRAMGLRGADFPPQDYLIGFRSNALVIIGRDWADTEANRGEMGRTIGDQRLAGLRHKIDYWKAVGLPERGPLELELPGVFDDQGTCYATYDFLERFCGVRWYGPTDLTSVIPKRGDLSAQGDDIRRAPALKHRNALSTASWPFLRGQWGTFTDAQVFLHWRRLRLGGEKWAGNHTIHRRTIETVLNDPDYQAQGSAKGLNLCYSNPKLVQTLAQMARDYFDVKGQLPEGFKALGDYFAIVPEDVAKYCACERCRALLDRGKDMRTGFFSSGEVSDYWFSFVNAVAREVRQTHPDKFIATLAYWNYAYPPRDFDLEPNVSIAPCLHTCAYAIDDAVRENDMKFYRAWLARAKAPVFLWNYYHHPMEPALIDKWKCFPNVMVHETARAARMFIQDGVRGIFECGEQDQLEHYVMLKLWDDPTLDTDALLDEFFTQYFGSAAQPMNRFYRSIERIACDQSLYPPKAHKQDRNIAWRNLGTPERMKELAALMAEAEAKAATGAEKQRVALWRNSLWKWMLDGRAEFEARTTKSDAKPAPPAESAAPIDQATLDAWAAPYRGWNYYPHTVIPADLKIPGYEAFHSFDVPTVFQVPGQPGKWFMSLIGFNGKGYNSFVVESTNLMSWTNPRLAMGFGPTNEFDHGGCVIGAFLYESYDIRSPRVLKRRDGKFWTLYGCYPRQGGYELRPGYEGVAISDDGLSWRRAKDAPILAVQDADCGTWEKDCIYQPWLVEHEARFYDFYNAANGGAEQMGGATSTNLLDWKRFAANPVVRNRLDGYDAQFCSDGKVFREGDHWVMFYFGVGKGGAHIMAAFSRDLRHWTSHPEPLYKAGGHPGGLDAQYAHKISLIHNSASDTFYLYYCAVGKEGVAGNKGRCIGLLTSRKLHANGAPLEGSK
jgi:hypothetical protein